jgi:hypothetical protein
MKIISEEPIEHWYFLTPKDKIILDLGCNKFYSSISTAQWFIEEGASTLIGVDLSLCDFQHEKFINHVDVINSSDKIKKYLEYKPQIIKCDIEGSEIYFDDIDDLPSVEEIAIEYHNELIKQSIEKKLNDWGFDKIITYQIFDEDINRIGVFHAWR